MEYRTSDHQGLRAVDKAKKCLKAPRAISQRGLNVLERHTQSIPTLRAGSAIWHILKHTCPHQRRENLIGKVSGPPSHFLTKNRFVDLVRPKKHSESALCQSAVLINRDRK